MADDWKQVVKSLLSQVRKHINNLEEEKILNKCNSILESIPREVPWDHTFAVRVISIKSAAKMHALEKKPAEYKKQMLSWLDDAEAAFQTI